jgi:hypothetical protein
VRTVQIGRSGSTMIGCGAVYGDEAIGEVIVYLRSQPW